MHRKTLFALATIIIATTAPLVAQNPPAATGTEEPDKEGNSPGNNRFWQAKLPGGHYMIALDRISSISRHSYLLDGVAVVDEVTIDSIGEALARFYFISPVTTNSPANTAAKLTARSQELIEKVADKTAPGMQDMVIKKYPETTHARTVEYRLLAEEQLTALYKSIQTSWESGRGRKFSIK